MDGVDSKAGVEDLPDAVDDPTFDAFFDVLSDRRRRYLLFRLDALGRSVALADLAGEIAVVEGTVEPGDDPTKTTKDVYTSLRHVHAPKLVAVNMIEYDRERNVVALLDGSEQTERYRELVSHFE